MSNPLSMPAAEPPPGVQQHLYNPPSQASSLILTVVICLTCSTFVVWMRTYVSKVILKSFKWDDALVLVNWVVLIGYSVISLGGLRFGAMVDMWNIRVSDAIRLIQMTYVEELIYSVLIFTTKLTVLVLYKRIFVPARGGQKWISHLIVFVIVFNGLFYVACAFGQAFRCTPVSKVWLLSIPGKCLDPYSLFISAAALNVISDIFMNLVPVAVLWRLQLTRRRKLEIWLVFGFGISCLGVSIARLVYTVRALHDVNQSVAGMKVGLWTFGEITSCFLASCVPMAPRLVRSFSNRSNERESPAIGHAKFTSPVFTPTKKQEDEKKMTSLISEVVTVDQSVIDAEITIKGYPAGIIPSSQVC